VLVLRSVVFGLVAFRDTHIHLDLDLDGRVAESVSGGREPEFEQDRRSVAAVSVVTVPSDSMVRVSVGTTSISVSASDVSVSAACASSAVWASATPAASR